jgi:hypothetical protein
MGRGDEAGGLTLSERTACADELDGGQAELKKKIIIIIIIK